MLNRATERCRLRERHQIPQGKSRSHRLVNGQCHLVLWLLSLPRLEHNVAGTDVALHTEFDPLLARTNLHGLTELLQVTTDLLEFRRRQLSHDLVVLLWDLHVFTFNLHELQVEVSDAIL